MEESTKHRTKLVTAESNPKLGILLNSIFKVNILDFIVNLFLVQFGFCIQFLDFMQTYLVLNILNLFVITMNF